MEGIIGKALREAVVKRAHNRCEYCQTQSEPTAMPMEVDHVIPVAENGPTNRDNLCLACSRCNQAKNDRMRGYDAISGEDVNLYNPRTQVWSEHFAWSDNGEELIGLTAVGRVTILTLNMNSSDFLRGRRAWVKAGWHPPKNAPQNEQR